MCLDHLREAKEYRVAGTTFGCPHDLRVVPKVSPVG
jgi:hypothetical protein